MRAAASTLDEGDEVVLTRSLEEAELTITLRNTDGAGTWLVGGRVWLHQPATGVIRVALVHESHVLTLVEIGDGEFFELEEVLPRHWHLEIHLPTGTCLRLDDLPR